MILVGYDCTVAIAAEKKKITKPFSARLCIFLQFVSKCTVLKKMHNNIYVK